MFCNVAVLLIDDDEDDDEIADFTVRWKTRASFVYRTKNEITPTKTVKTENGPISRGSQSEMSMVWDLWGKWFTKEVSFEFRVKGWYMGKVENRRMDWGKHQEVKLVHEVKMEVDSRDEAKHTEKSDLWPWGKRREIMYMI